MDAVRVIEIKKSVFEDNDRAADAMRRELKAKGVYLLNLMSSPGSGKTTTLIQVINRLKDKIRIAVMEADIDSDVDAIKIKEATGVESIQLHTGGMCHLDAEMTGQGLAGLEPTAVNDSMLVSDAVGEPSAVNDSMLTRSHQHEVTNTQSPTHSHQQYDLIILENVGNLVCPAEFDTGAVKNAMILSVPEGHDKPLKYPLMFSVCDLVIINKIDVLPYFDFDLDKCKEYIHMRNPKAQVIPICAKTGENIDAFANWLLKEVSDWKQ